MQKIGITTTIPIEILISAGFQPVDLNNIFITSNKCSRYIEDAEKFGFPRTTCSWIKGIFSVCMELQLKKVIAVTQGDCSNTHALMETLQFAGIEVTPFAYPYDKDQQFLRREINKLINTLGTTWKNVNDTKKYLDNTIRKKLKLIDSYTWKKNLIKGKENHYYLVNSSDFKGNPDIYLTEVNNFLDKITKRKPIKNKIRIGYTGIPTVFTDLYENIDTLGGHVVFNEIQRQFSMPYKTSTVVNQYLLYTYPYSIFERIEDMKNAIATRKIDGIINFVQTFCFRHIEDIILRKRLQIPLITLEGDKPGPLDARAKLRLETFFQMIKENIPLQSNKNKQSELF